ncbi:HNH endonuclease [Paraburkholderia acidisoli]|uniref:Fis family transcriptional regulator n=1 Tax=Paraburkholderia acidisoli TaxID=2571748 RepID=A0A7Z2JHY3_9BURK|nr:HNH endonuclease [Paraburkholderia acidisoli]QGZ66307.1 Fis family transcriptional regulator [Paraburkholderia acidisoli]
MREIPLSKGLTAIVDDEDFDTLRGFNWFVSSWGYAVRNAGGKQIRMHRQIMGVENNRQILIDHINMDRLDNRRSNLRSCTQSQNLSNRPSPKNSTGFKGVTKRNKKWTPRIFYKGRMRHLGCYTTPEEAHEVYCLWADLIQGEFAHYGVKACPSTPT